MATSGTVGTTRFSLAKIIEHAMRRCKLNPALISVELIETAKDALYLILTSLANRGLNLWRVEHGFLGLAVGVNRYDLPTSTIRVANLNFVTNTLADTTFSAVAGGFQAALATAITTTRIGFKPTASFTAALTLLTSTDGVSYTSQLVLPSATYSINKWYWFDVPVSEAILGARVTSGAAFTLSDLVLSASNFITPMTQWNRTDYSQQPQRTQPGRPSTNYYYDRQLSSQLWVWPNVQNEADHLEYWFHRLIEDINLLTEEVDIPTQWTNAAVWLLAKEFCFVLPGVDPVTIQLVMGEADRVLNEAEEGDSDGSSTFLVPQIGVYTR